MVASDTIKLLSLTRWKNSFPHSGQARCRSCNYILMKCVFGGSNVCLFFISDRVVLLRQLEPLQVRVGGTASFTCFPFNVLRDRPVFFRDGSPIDINDPRYSFVGIISSFQDFSTMKFRIAGVTRNDDQARFRCTVGDLVSNEVILTIYGQYN